MFGFGNKRKKFEQEVSDILQHNLNIDTNNETNPNFMSPITYMDRLSEGWHGNRTAEHFSIALALGYWGELLENKDNTTNVEAKNLRLKLEEFIRICVGKGIINEALQDHVIDNLNKHG
mgnify:FL=1